MKKEYGSPELEKLALEDEDLERVSGGTEEEDYGGAGYSDIEDRGCAGPSDIKSRGRGGGCGDVHLHRSARTFSDSRSSSCWGRV